MSSTVQIRMFLARATAQEIEQGVQFNRLPIGPIDPSTGQQPHGLFKVGVFQFRSKERTYLNGAPVVEWGEWEQVLPVREGVDDVTP